MMKRRQFIAVAGASLTAGCTESFAGGGQPTVNQTERNESTGTTGGTQSTPAVTQSPSVTDVSLLLNWKPNGLHVPYYAAAEQGFYEDEGLNLERIEAGQGSDFSAKQVGLGNTSFAITSSDQVLNVNSRDLSALSVGVIMQQSPVVVFSTRETLGGELSQASQLAGTTIGTGPGMVRMLTELYLEKTGVRSEVELVDTGYDTVQQLLAGKIDAAGGVFGDAIAASAQGYTTDSLQVGSEVPAYGHVVATEQGFATDHPETVSAFLRATARGTVWARSNVEAAIDALISANESLAESRDQQRQKWLQLADAHVMSETVQEQGWGWSESDPWQVTADALRNNDQLGGDVDPQSVWTNEYLDTEAPAIGEYAAHVSN
ncbi:ABC transporter substrate-binding protein [Halomarina rubra]|uniref:Thiamine pyrimidine synthase n=1 Tax=Halomarina rubra TaxID=2071873 RepID=A0ABD6AWK5_9EURY|nr:ABC transporter substrate-binding protein [Halomarina rubra]